MVGAQLGWDGGIRWIVVAGWFFIKFLCQFLQWGAANAEIEVPFVRTQSLNVIPLKPEVGQYIAILATLTARDFFLAYFYLSSPFACIFPKPVPVFPVLAVANTSSGVGPENKIGHSAGCRFPC